MGKEVRPTWVSSVRKLLELSARRNPDPIKIQDAIALERTLRDSEFSGHEEDCRKKIRRGWVEPKVFTERAKMLASGGHAEFADKLLELEELIYETHVGVTRATLKAYRGDHAQAVADLVAIASTSTGDMEARLRAIDELDHLGERQHVIDRLIALVSERAHAGEFPIAADLCRTLCGRFARMGPGSAPWWQPLDRLNRYEESYFDKYGIGPAAWEGDPSWP